MYMNGQFPPNLSRTGTKSAILSLVPQFAKSYRPKVLDRQYLSVLSELYNDESGSLLRGEFLQKCENIFENVTATAEEALNCEKAARQQANTKQWFNFRVGRVTASRAKRVCRSSPEYPSTSIINEICYPDSKTFFAKQIKWGCDHEKNAKVQYVKNMSGVHTNFQWHDSGLLIINPAFPYLGASPYGRATCE